MLSISPPVFSDICLIKDKCGSKIFFVRFLVETILITSALYYFLLALVVMHETGNKMNRIKML